MLGRQASDYKTALINRNNQTDWTNTLGIIWEKRSPGDVWPRTNNTCALE
jgi:hypothetical protein